MAETTVAKERHVRAEQHKPGVLLEAVDLWKEYAAPSGSLKVLRGVLLEVKEGEMVYILGRSGSGKSTLLHLIGGLDTPSKGSVRFRGIGLSSLPDPELCRYRNHRVGFVFQFYHLLPELTLFENVLLPGVISGKLRKRQAEELIARVGLSERKHHYPAQLSGGEQQRTAIARALVNDPDIILCDEPTGNLDDETARSVFDVLVELNRQEKKTFLIVTHEADLIREGQSVYHLQDGILKRG